MPEQRKCVHCGHIGPDVREWGSHVGGHTGSVYVTECDDRMACWRRIDAQAGQEEKTCE